MLNILKVLFVVHIAALNSALEQMQFRVIRQWEYLNYTWPTSESIQTAVTIGQYIPENIVTAGVIYFDDWFYLTMPRMKHGVPATLGRISATTGGSTAPLVTPYPSWELNKLGDCNALQNVQNIEIDSKGQMWIIDGGHAASLTNAPIRNCSAKIVIFDIKSNKVTTKYEFPESVASKYNTFLYDIVVDGEFAYITDNSRHDPGIIVFSREQKHAWKIRHSKTMQADPLAQNFTVNGVAISTPINIAGIAMAPSIQDNNNEDREVFYCPLSSFHLYSINTSILRNESNSNNGLDYPGKIKDVGRKASQTDGMIMTNEGILYYGLLANNSIAKWDSHMPFASGQQILSKDSTYIQWTNSFTRDRDGNVIVLTNTLQEFVYTKLSLNQSNFWLLSAHAREKKSLNNETFAAKNTTMDVNVNISLDENKSNHSSILSGNVNVSAPPAGGNQQVLDFSVIIMLVIFWLSYRI